MGLMGYRLKLNPSSNKLTLLFKECEDILYKGVVQAYQAEVEGKGVAGIYLAVQSTFVYELLIDGPGTCEESCECD